MVTSKHLFESHPDFAWQLLAAEISIDFQEVPSQEIITHLLTLYMRAVEILNSVRDSRDIWFRNKMNNFMLKPSVQNSFESNAPKQESSPQKKQLQIKRMQVNQSKQKFKKALIYSQTQKVQNILSECQRTAHLKEKIISKELDSQQSNIQARLHNRRKAKTFSKPDIEDHTYQFPTIQLQIIEEDQPKNYKRKEHLIESILIPRRNDQHVRRSLSPKRLRPLSKEQLEQLRLSRMLV